MKTFGADYYPTPKLAIDKMLEGEEVKGKICWEPEAGNGGIVDELKLRGASQVIACELHPDLRTIVQTKCKVIAPDCLTVTSDMVSHVQLIVMNPPYSADEKHILHIWNIAPAGCRIKALCNWNTIDFASNRIRKELVNVIEEHGSAINLGAIFSSADRTTSVDIGLITLVKPGSSYDQEFAGFFMEEETDNESQVAGIMQYNFIRDIVNRYIAAVKLFDKQLETGTMMNELTSGFFRSKLGFTCTVDGKPGERNEFKKDLQKEAWLFVFQKMNMAKYTTKGLKEDINKFVEQQHNIPFTMKNIWKMIEIVAGTQEQRMDRALIEVYEMLTKHSDENRYFVEGWKTNSHYLVNQRFIIGWMVSRCHGGGFELNHSGNYERIDDLNKALCYISGENYDNIKSMWYSFNGVRTKETEHLPSYQQRRVVFEFGKWYEFAFFKIKAFKKGTMHFEFRDKNLWQNFNKRIAKIQGYPLPEFRNQTGWQKRNHGTFKTKEEAA